MQQLLESWVTAGFTPGLTAAVVSDTGSWSGAAGVDGAGAKLAANSTAAIGSVTKTFVAAEVMHLAAEGEIDLDAPMSRYVHHDLTANGVTIRQALAMRSGLPRGGKTPLSQILTKPERHWDLREDLADITGPRGPAGRSFQYNNFNFSLLGLLVESVTGESLAHALRADLLDPAGLNRIAIQDAERPSPPLAAPGEDTLARFATKGPYLPNRAVASIHRADGGTAGDAPSVARWGYLLYGGHVLPGESVKQMTRFGPEDYGLATQQFEVNGLQCVGHLGEIEGYRAALVVIPKRRTAIAILIPHATSPFPFVSRLASAMGISS